MNRIALNKARAAFTLIEVLIGVVVLSLGLLGLGAVIPVVVSEQRRAMESQLGLEAAKAARAYLTSRPDLDPTTPFQFTTGQNPVAKPTIGWDVWLMDKQNWSPPAVGAPAANCYLWESWKTGGGSSNEMDLTTGDFGWKGPSTQPPSNVHAMITLADRLWPSESVQGSEILRPGFDPHRPLFVWDLIGRRVQTRAGEPERLQIAVFVRRLDLNIRVPRGNHAASNPQQPFTLRDVVLDRLDNSPNSAQACVPVCSYSNSAGAQAYLPTNTGQLANGTRNYSEIISLDVSTGVTPWFNPKYSSSWLRLTGLNDNRWKLVSQPGQKLVDNLGNVYTVRGTLEELDPTGYQDPAYINQPVLVIDPPIPAFVPNPAGNPAPPANSPGSLRQIIFTPQPPAAIDVVTITRTVP